MKLLTLTIPSAICASIISSTAYAKTATATIAVGAKIVAGNSVSAFLTGNDVGTIVSAGGVARPLGGTRPLILTVSFDSEPYFVKLVTWDKSHRVLTINF